MKPAHATSLLQAQGLVKSFGKGKGIFDVDLTVHQGEIVGFVGPNGAGKSTTINVLTGLVRPDQGALKVFGSTVDHTSIYRFMPRIGVMFSEQTIDEDITAAEVFTRSERLLGKPCRTQWQEMSRMLELDTTRKVKKLSLGNRKKIGVVYALMHDPELLIMDEPTSGLDPLIRERFMTMMTERAAKGCGVLMSSHDLGEVQQICHRIIMLKAGKVILSDTTEAILNKAGRTFRLVSPPGALLQKIRTDLGTTVEQDGGNEVILQARDHAALLNLLTASMFYNFYVERPTLETAFKEYYQ